jgi:hypothetical protein
LADPFISRVIIIKKRQIITLITKLLLSQLLCLKIVIL